MDSFLTRARVGELKVAGRSLRVRVPFRPAVTGHLVAMVTLHQLLLKACGLVGDAHEGPWLVLRSSRVTHASALRQVSAGGAGHSHAAAPAKLSSGLNDALCGVLGVRELTVSDVDTGSCSERGGPVAARHGAGSGALGRPAVSVQRAAVLTVFHALSLSGREAAVAGTAGSGRRHGGLAV